MGDFNLALVIVAIVVAYFPKFVVVLGLSVSAISILLWIVVYVVDALLVFSLFRLLCFITKAIRIRRLARDADLLKRSWRNEKAAPEILKFEGSLVQRSREQIQLMEETVEELMQNGEDPLTVSLYQMDIDRTTFLLRSYLRTRLQKIEKFMFHIQKTADLWARLSKQEQKFARRSIEDMKQHFEQSVLSKLPERYNSHSKQSVISEEDDMVAEPKLDSFVICRTRKFLGALPVDDSGEENPLDMYAGDIYALRYKSIKPLIESGQLDLV